MVSAGVLEVVFGALIAIGTTIVVEYLRRPHLEISIADPVDQQYPPGSGRPVTEARYLGVNVLNKPLSWWARWMSRGAALDCRGTIRFLDMEGNELFDDPMPGRWSSTPELLPLRAQINGRQLTIIDPVRFTLASKVDIQPGEAEKLDIVNRYDTDPECYGWNNESYISNPPWRNPDRELPPGRYIAEVTVTGSGVTVTESFLILNKGSRDEFRLASVPGDGVE